MQPSFLFLYKDYILLIVKKQISQVKNRIKKEQTVDLIKNIACYWYLTCNRMALLRL